MIGHRQRIEKRNRVLKRAQIVFGLNGSTIDCMVIDENRYGVLLETPLITNVPGQVKIRFMDGVTFEAHRRWAIGRKIGFEFLGVKMPGDGSPTLPSAIIAILQERGPHAAIAVLREAAFLDNSELKAAASAVETALAHLEATLNKS